MKNFARKSTPCAVSCRASATWRRECDPWNHPRHHDDPDV